MFIPQLGLSIPITNSDSSRYLRPYKVYHTLPGFLIPDPMNVGKSLYHFATQPYVSYIIIRTNIKCISNLNINLSYFRGMCLRPFTDDTFQIKSINLNVSRTPRGTWTRYTTTSTTSVRRAHKKVFYKSSLFYWNIYVYFMQQSLYICTFKSSIECSDTIYFIRCRTLRNTRLDGKLLCCTGTPRHTNVGLP